MQKAKWTDADEDDEDVIELPRMENNDGFPFPGFDGIPPFPEMFGNRGSS
ncbi:MAG: hypothetical protein JRZ94_04665 [Nitrososphaerota archaeon]|nr:hypothetical protein [Nitrososphaerota archaeon]